MGADEQGWGDGGGLNEHKLWQTQTSRHKERRAQVMLSPLPLFSPSSGSNLLSLSLTPPPPPFALFPPFVWLTSSTTCEPRLKSSRSRLPAGCNCRLTGAQDAVVFVLLQWREKRKRFSEVRPPATSLHSTRNRGLGVGFNWHHYNNHR